MKKLLVPLLIVALGLVPVLVSAQGTGGTGGTLGGSGMSGPSSTPTRPDTSTSDKSGVSSSVPPSASPRTSPTPGASPDMVQFKTRADCERAGGTWVESTSVCQKTIK